MPEEITFTTAAFGGFEKKQVLDYILKMHEEIDVEKDKQRKKLEDISYAFKELELRAVKAEKLNQTLKIENASAQKALANEQTAVANIQAAKNDLEDRLNQMVQKATQTERILAQRQKQEAEVVVSQEYKEQPKPEPIQTNYDQSAQIGRVMLDAHSKANGIIEQARHDAERIISEAHRNFEQRMQQNEGYYNQYKLAKEDEATKAVEAVKARANVQINQIYEYMSSIINRVIKTADDTKEKLVDINHQLKGIKPSGSSVEPVLFNEPVAYPPISPPPVRNQTDFTTNISDFPLSEKYSDLLKYEPKTLEKPRIEYTEDSPYNSVFPQATGDSYPAKSSTASEYNPAAQEPTPPRSQQAQPEPSRVRDQHRQPSYQPAPAQPLEPTTASKAPPLHRANDYHVDPITIENPAPQPNVAVPKREAPAPETGTSNVEFNFKTNRDPQSEKLDNYEGDEITFPSLNP